MGAAIINILDATTLINSPRLYSTFLLWLLAELFEQLPEVGDPDKPKLVFFFDEASTFCSTMRPRRCSTRSEQVVRADPVQGSGRLLRDAESQGPAGNRAGPARLPHPACAPGLHAD